MSEHRVGFTGVDLDEVRCRCGATFMRMWGDRRRLCDRCRADSDASRAAQRRANARRWALENPHRAAAHQKTHRKKRRSGDLSDGRRRGDDE